MSNLQYPPKRKQKRLIKTRKRRFISTLFEKVES